MEYIQNIISKALSGKRLSHDELSFLLKIEKNDGLNLLYAAADKLRKSICGDIVTYIKNRNFNFTNICRNECKFCAFKRNHDDKDAYISPIENLIDDLDISITEVCIQGGLNEDLDIDFYVTILQKIKAKHPSIHIHAFSPMEIAFISEKSKISIDNVLSILKENGLGSIPGTAAEILSDDVRKKICPDKISADEWIKIIKAAHNLHIPTTATVMFGHIETPEQLATHLSIIRDIQEETLGFTELVPLPFIATNTALAKEYQIPAYNVQNVFRLFAVSRLYFGSLLPNIQASWVKIGKENVKKSLSCGVNDIGGTLGEENISKAAGATYGISITEQELIELTISAGKIPLERDTLYRYPDKKNPSSYIQSL